MRLAPDAHGVDDGLEAAAAIGERIFDARRHFGKYFTLEQAVFFHGTQIRGKHFLGDAADGFLQLAKAFRAGKKVTKDEDFPFVRHEGKRCFDGR